MQPAHRSLTLTATLLAILLLAFALRVVALDAQSLWYDEAVTAQVAQQGLGELAQWTADDIQPPLYYALVAGWTRLAGTGEWALRFPSVAFGLAMVALAFALGRRLFGPTAGWVAALLGALHPLWVYYAQEARMYTLLTSLGMLAGYALLRVLAPTQEPGAARHRLTWWAAFVGASIALLYTHYFAAFLLLAFALFFVLAWVFQPGRKSSGATRRQLLAEGAVAALLVVVAYLPWLPNALRRFQIDASYWQGTLKLDEAVRHIAISFTTGETVLEQRAIPLAWGLALLAGVCLVALAWTALRERRTADGRRQTVDSGRESAVGGRRSAVGSPSAISHARNSAPCTLPLATLFVTLYLLVPIVAILLLSYRTPKFNPRYLMLASPALVLLLAGGLTLPFTGRSGRSAPHGIAARASRLVAVLALLAVVSVFLVADRNWFVDPAFTKDDWRGAVAAVRSQLQPDEAAVLVSGHALPAWRYYAPDVEPLRLPELEVLDVTTVLDLESAAAALDIGLSGKQGAWLVQWQNDVVDPTGVVPYLLESAGTRQPSEASFWGLGSPQHFRWPAGTNFQSLAEPPLDAEHRGQEVHVNFGNQVELVGFSQPPCDQADCPLTLFWRALAPLQADYKLNATLLGRDFDGVWSQHADRRLAAYNYPTFRWPAEGVVLSQLPLNANLGTPPGEYRLRLGVYDDATGQALDVIDAAGAPQGRWAWIEPVVIDDVVVEGPGEAPVSGNETRMAPGILLSDLRLSTAEVTPGDRFLTDAWWLVEQPQGKDYALSVEWLDPAGETALGPVCSTVPFSQWPAAAPVHTQLYWAAPTDITPGPWHIRFGLQEDECTDQASYLGETLDVPIELVPSNRQFEPSTPVQVPSATALGGVVELVGITVANASERSVPVQPGATVPVTVTWRAIQPMDTSYTGFVHLLDAGGQIVAQDDHGPLQNQYPTTQWAGGEVVEDRYVLRLPPNLLPGEYTLEIGLYDANRPGLPRLKATDGRDSVRPGTLVVAR